MIMQSARSDGTSHDIKATVAHKPELAEKILALHVSSGMDTAAAAHIIAKIKADEKQRRIKEMTMDKSQQKEVESMEELLHNRVRIFLA